MNRETMAALADPAFKAAYTAALADGERIHGEGHADALSYAETAAHLALEQTAQADARKARLIADAQARHDASKATPAQQTEPQPDPAKAGWTKAVAQLNDANGFTAQADSAAKIETTAASGWAKAFDTTQTAEPKKPAEATDKADRDRAPATGWAKAFGTSG